MHHNTSRRPRQLTVRCGTWTTHQLIMCALCLCFCENTSAWKSAGSLLLRSPRRRQGYTPNPSISLTTPQFPGWRFRRLLLPEWNRCRCPGRARCFGNLRARWQRKREHFSPIVRIVRN
ncbi:hypothetical protein IWX49DRAFT_584918, partial [Phyllosticta citricarpa]